MISLQGHAQAPDSLPIPVKLRDMRECIGNGPTSTCAANSQTDFQHVASCPDVGYVETAIATDRPVLDTINFPYDNRSPVKTTKLASTSGVKCYTSVARFEDWFNDKTGAPGSADDINRPFMKNLVLHRNGAIYTYDNTSFFPLDTVSSLTKLHPGDPDPYGMLQAAPNNTHNYGFTMEFHATFTYLAGTAQNFSFRGDDDVWVFINGQLVIDLGGRHGVLNGSVNLDQVATQLNLQDGFPYFLDFFFAERHTTASNCLISTSLQLTAEQEPSLAFVDSTGKELSPNQFWSPTDKVFLVYKDDYRKDLHKTVTINVKNKKGQNDVETIDMGAPTQDKFLGIWKVQVPLGESPAATSNNGVVETYVLGEMTASVPSHSFKGTPDGNSVSAQLRVAYPDGPATIIVKSDTGVVDRYTKDITIEIHDQSYSKFVDTVYAEVRCNQTGDVVTLIPVYEVSPGVYKTVIKKDENGALADKVLQCQVSDQAVPKYIDQVYGTPGQATQASWTSKGASVFNYTLKAGDPATSVDSVKDGVNNTFYIYVKVLDPNIHARDKQHITLTTSNSTSDQETIELTETDTATGIFVSGPIPYTFGNANPTPNDKKIEAVLDPTGKSNLVVLSGVMVEDNGLKRTLNLVSSFNQVVKAYIKDENGDGAGDHIYIRFTKPLLLPPDATQLMSYWNDGTTQFQQKGVPEVSVIPGGDGTLVMLDYSAHPFPKGLTGIPDNGAPRVDLPPNSIFGGQKAPVADSMGPIINQATVYPYNPNTPLPPGTTSTFGTDTIVIVVSEKVRTQNNFLQMLYFAKSAPGQACPDYSQARLIKDVTEKPKISDDGLTYTYIVPLSSETPITGDCLYIKADGTYTDMILNVAPKNGTKMGGNPPPKKVAIQAFPAVVGCEPTDPCFSVANNDSHDGTRYARPTGNGESVGIFLPVGYTDNRAVQYTEVFPNPGDTVVAGVTDKSKGEPLPPDISTVQVVSTGRYRCNVSVYDHLGNFMNSWQQAFGFRGELYNNDRIVPGGMVSYLVWNLKDKKGRHAGQGVYIWKMQFYFDDNRQEIRYTRTGVLRKASNMVP